MVCAGDVYLLEAREMGVVGVFCHTGDTVRGKIEVPEGSYGSLGS